MIRERLFGIAIDVLTLDEAVARALELVGRRDGVCRYVVTPNVDHVLLFQQHDPLRMAYRDAALVLADGFPVVLASRVLGRPLPERVAGSDLVPALFGEVKPPNRLRVFLLGAGPQVAERAARVIGQRYPAVEVVGTHSPPRGFEQDDAMNDAIVDLVRATGTDVLVLGLGTPKQELWIHRHGPRLGVPLALCVGATIDFLAGQRRRAPRWMQRVGLEWAYRAASEPGRLVGRYARNAVGFPPLVVREWLSNRRA